MFRLWMSDGSEEDGSSNTTSHRNTTTRVKRKKRTSPTSSTTVNSTTTTLPPPPGYRYALQEFQQTIPFGSADEDGSSVLTTSNSTMQQQQAAAAGYVQAPDHAPTTTSSPQQQHQHHQQASSPPQQNTTSSAPPYSPSGNSSYLYRARQPFPETVTSTATAHLLLPDKIYDEWYGDAYVGGPIKYLYPSGYQSMRPRGGPWRLSIAICLLFTWLSVFIIGHCSDRVDQNLYQPYDDDDQEMAIQTRWCGSQTLYGMWVMSMLITGLSAAYCSVIGYIKVRDFAVANTRSQPPGWVGNSDYFNHANDNNNNDNRNIYQADGTPQFWGSHIYRPTQAAAAVTSR